MKPNMAEKEEEDQKGLPEGNEDGMQSKVDDAKEVKNEEAVQMDVDGIEIGGSADLGLQKSDKESGRNKVDDGSELVGSSGRKNVKRTQQNTTFVPNKTRRTDDGTKIGGGTGDIQSKVDEFGRNADLGIQENVDFGTNQENVETVAGGKKADILMGGVEEEQGEGNQEDDPAPAVQQNRPVENMESNMRVLMKSMEEERQLIEGFSGHVREVGGMIDREEIYQHLSNHLRFKLEQEKIILKMMSLSITTTTTTTTTTGVQTINGDDDDDDGQTNKAGAGVSEGINNE